MAIEQGIVYRLTTYVTLTDIVAAANIGPLATKQTASVPRIVYETTSTEHDRSFYGASGGLAETTMDLDCIAGTYAQAKQIAGIVRARLDRFYGNIASVAGGFDETVEFINLVDMDDAYSQPADGGDKGTYTVRLTFQIWHGTTVPAGP